VICLLRRDTQVTTSRKPPLVWAASWAAYAFGVASSRLNLPVEAFDCLIRDV
jgi:hypothetical protein